jgi:predicted NACHT family NTPase
LRIVSAALRYVNEGDPENDKWFNTSTIYGTAIGGFQALGLLLRVAPEKLSAISLSAWSKWIPILLKYPYGESGRLNLQPLLIQAAYSRTPGEIIARLEQAIDSENDSNGYLFVIHKMDLCWDERLGAALLAKAREPHLKQPVVRELLQRLLEHNVTGSRELAKSFITVPPPDS